MTGSESTPTPENLMLDALRATRQGTDWLHAAQRHIAGAADPEQELMILSAQARRRMGTSPLASEGLSLASEGGPLKIGDWTLGDTARVLLLLQAVRKCPQQEREMVSKYFQQGDEPERAAVVRSLMLLPRSCEHKTVALEAGRTNSLLLFTALAQDNPFCAACYTEHEFNQLVLKCLFTGLKLEHVIGLQRRANPNLSRMCEDYLDERLAAYRLVPRDIWLGLAPFASPHAIGLMIDYLADTDSNHRYYAAVAASQLKDQSPALAEALLQRQHSETEPRIQEVLSRTHSNPI